MRQEETIRREILEQRIDRELEALSEKLFGKKLEDASDEQVAKLREAAIAQE